MKKTALVLGATGGVGSEVARLLVARGWNVKALHRTPAQSTRGSDGLQWLQGDAMIRDDVVSAAHGVQLIVHAVNPPGYRNWGQLVLPMIDNTIAAARASGARILLPGTVYNYGPDSFADIREDSPQRPATRKGAIRAELEARLAKATDDGVRSLIVRAGDFFGPRAGNSWFAQGLVKPGRPLVPLFRELLEMRYLWQTPVRMSNAKLVAMLGAEPHTPLDTAVRATLDGLGCLPAAQPARAQIRPRLRA